MTGMYVGGLLAGTACSGLLLVLYGLSPLPGG